MKIGILSDTHGNRKAIDVALLNQPEVELWLHVGDYTRDGEYLRKQSRVPVKMIAGNNDIFFGNKYSEAEYFEAGGKNFWMTHGHRQHVKWGTKALLEEGCGYGADVIVFGHTHEALLEKHGNTLLVNPGAAAFWGGSYAVLTIEGDDIKTEIMEIG